MPEASHGQPSGQLLISHVIRLAHRSQNKIADPFSDEGGKQITRCPMPDHPDDNPSCDFDNDQGRSGHFNCRSCGESGFADQLAHRLFPGRSSLNLLAEARVLAGSAPIAAPSGEVPRRTRTVQSSVPGGEPRAVAPKLRNHRQALPPDADAAAIAKRRHDLLSVNEAAGRWYQGHLASQTSLTTAADPERLGRTYFRRRGVDDNTHAEFRLGYAPWNTSDALYMHLHQRGFPALLPVHADIFRSGKNSPNYVYSPFEGRAMLPMQNEDGHIIGFGGRMVDRPDVSGKAAKAAARQPGGKGPEKAKSYHPPKYMHSANVWIVEDTTALFKKGDWLFNMHRARGPASNAGRLLVVEGYLDVIGLHQAGIREVVSPIGVSLSETQLRRLWQLVDTPIICLDGDDAGRRAAGRLAARAYGVLYPDAMNTLVRSVAETLADKPSKLLSEGECASLADQAAVIAVNAADRKDLNFVLLGGSKDPFDVVREGTDHALKRAIMDLRPYSGEELSAAMRRGGANAFEERLRNPTTMAAMLAEKLARDAEDAIKRASRAPTLPDSKRKRDDELEPSSVKRRKDSVPEAAAALEAYLARRNLIRHQILFPLLCWEARSPIASKAEAGDAASSASILELRRDLKIALATLYQAERQLLHPLAAAFSDKHIATIVSATMALQDHDRAQSPEWRMDLPIGSLPPLRLPFSAALSPFVQSPPAHVARVSDGREAVSARARNYALINRDLRRFGAATDAFIEIALVDAPDAARSMIDAGNLCRARVQGILDQRLRLHRRELPLADRSGKGSTLTNVDLAPDRRLDQRSRERDPRGASPR